MSEHKHVANRHNPLIGRGVSRGSAHNQDGTPSYCVCPSCGTRTRQKIGIPCNTVSCIKCRGPMAQG